MNAYLIASGVVAGMILVGHSTVGRKQFFLPVLDLSFDPYAKRVMEFVWHMSTASLVLPPAILIYAGIIGVGETSMSYLVILVALQFAMWGAIHLLLTVTSSLPGAIYKLFQWALFFAVAGLATAGLGLA